MDLAQSMEQLPSCFAENELAYFALTGKIERQVQDKLTFLLHKTLVDQHVWREWKNIDIAALDENGEPKILIELTAVQTFDLALTPEPITDGLLRKVNKEQSKFRQFSGKSTESYTILLATHLNSPVAEKYKTNVKYYKNLERAFTKVFYPNKIKSMAQEQINNTFIQREFVISGELNVGEEFGVEVSVLYWIYKGIC